MGTRGFVGFVVDGTEKIAYNHNDSYPDGLGLDMLRWLQSADVAQVREQARALRVVGEREEPTDEDAERLSQFTDRGVGGPSERPTWYQLLRRTQGEPGLMLEAGVIEDAGTFPLDSLFAEWGYVVDFDTGTFEAYQGFQHDAHEAGRFADRTSTPRDGYYPCRLVGSWALTALPDEKAFLEAVEPSDTTGDQS